MCDHNSYWIKSKQQTSTQTHGHSYTQASYLSFRNLLFALWCERVLWENFRCCVVFLFPFLCLFSFYRSVVISGSVRDRKNKRELKRIFMYVWLCVHSNSHTLLDILYDFISSLTFMVLDKAASTCTILIETHWKWLLCHVTVSSFFCSLPPFKCANHTSIDTRDQNESRIVCLCMCRKWNFGTKAKNYFRYWFNFHRWFYFIIFSLRIVCRISLGK